MVPQGKRAAGAASGRVTFSDVELRSMDSRGGRPYVAGGRTYAMIKLLQ